MKKYIFIILACFTHNNYAEQFIYPVADFDNGKKLMVLHQKSLLNLELWIWDTTTQHAIKGISSFLTPANLRMMPSGRGFSFIDQGYIKIKEFAKRSPKTLPIYEPIGLFSNMNWIDHESFYFVAREGDFFQIFQGNLQAQVQRLTSESADALYPQKAGSHLFYMKRDMNGRVVIVKQAWNPVAMTSQQEVPQEVIMQNQSGLQLCFLRMISATEGFYLQAPTYKNRGNYDFACYHFLENNDGTWKSEKLFSFSIPSKYLTGSTRLYESLEPFLPNHSIQDSIYFTNWDNEHNKFYLKKFDMITKTLECIEESNMHRNSNSYIFGPYIHNKTIHCGFIVPDQETRNKKRGIDIFEMSDVYFELPTLSVE